MQPHVSAFVGGTGNILEVARAMRGDLRKSDRKVCDTILADPRRILSATVAETAQLADVSQPTVIRFCNAVGCDGFQDFKLRLAQALALGVPATHSVITDADSPDAVARKIFDYTMTSLDWARNRLDSAALSRAVDVLLAARRIEFFGFGASPWTRSRNSRCSAFPAARRSIRTSRSWSPRS